VALNHSYPFARARALARDLLALRCPANREGAAPPSADKEETDGGASIPAEKEENTPQPSGGVGVDGTARGGGGSGPLLGVIPAASGAAGLPPPPPPPGAPLLLRLRRLVTEVGNAVGAARLIAAAGTYQLGAAAPLFNWDPLSAFSFKNMAAEGHMALETQQAAETIDTMISQLHRGVTGYDESFFQSLSAVYQEETATPSAAFEDQSPPFALAIPALCINWAEASLQAKEAVFKSNQTREAYHTDDGFALGIAFLLAVFRQDDLYDSLNWRQTIEEYYKMQEDPKHNANNKDDDDDDSNLLSTTRVRSLFREHETLLFTLEAARSLLCTTCQSKMCANSLDHQSSLSLSASHSHGFWSSSDDEEDDKKVNDDQAQYGGSDDEW